MIQIRCNNHDSQAKGKVLLGEFNDTVIQLMSLMDKKTNRTKENNVSIRPTLRKH